MGMSNIEGSSEGLTSRCQWPRRLPSSSSPPLAICEEVFGATRHDDEQEERTRGGQRDGKESTFEARWLSTDRRQGRKRETRSMSRY